MRAALLPAALLLSACSQSQETSAEQPAVRAEAPERALTIFAGAGRNRLCLDEGAGRAAFITYGEGDANCTVQGAVQQTAGTSVLVPDGDTTCRIDLTLSGDMVRLGQASAACAYYCGPRSSFAGAEFRRSVTQQPVADHAGDPLC